MRIELDNHEKQLIHGPHMRRKTTDIAYEELQDLVGYLAAECKHCRRKKLAAELDELCDRLECEL